ncbi:YadA-like family protein [Burkholderia seminalis]|uniref:YadA-like family protein n=1 Tax=Burkholderia seminalis TaxID=488731 RepID=UPI002A35B2AC|nr:YadA-like family protein [Burkholderia seminalis]
MNKTYRTVWNATTGTWTAAAETARMRTKSKSNTTMRSSVTAAVAVMAGIGGGAMSVDANAQAANGNGMLGLCSPSGSSRVGTAFGGGNSSGTALTTGACGASPIFNNRSTSFMLYNNATANGTSTGSRGSAGTEAGIQGSTDGHLTLLGGAGVHVIGAADFSANVNMTDHRITGLAAGTAGTDAVNLNQLNSAIAAANTAANPYVVTNTGTYAAATAARAGSSATAIGANANAAGTSAVALGGNTVASSQNATAIGTLASATGSESTAIGASARAFGNGSTALGQAAYVDATSTGSLALGQGAAVTRTNANSSNMIAIGANARAGDSGAGVSTGAIAIGSGANAGGNGSIMIGTNARHSGSDATVVGANSSAMGGGAGTVLGSNSSASGSASVVVGSGATASGANAVALGTGSIANANNTVSVGSATTQRRITNLASGTANTDAVNLGQMNTALSTKVDNTYFKVNSTGAAADAAGANATAIGPNAKANGRSSTAIGLNARADGIASTTLGTDAVIEEGANSAGGTYSAQNSLALGNGARVSATSGNARNSVALGNGASVSAESAVAIGNSSVANVANTVSVGNSTTQRRIVNVGAGTQSTDAVNVGQLSGVTKALGGGAAVDGSGNVTQPTYKVAGTDYHNVGDALDALAASGGTDPNAVTYDGATKDKVTLKGVGGTTLSNVKAGVANTDAVNVGQMNTALSAKVDTNVLAVNRNGSALAAASAANAYDVALGQASLAQGGVVGSGFTPATALGTRANAIGYGAVSVGYRATASADSSLAIGRAATANSLNSVALGAESDTGVRANTVSIGRAGAERQITNVAAGTQDTDAVNVGQLKGSGLIGDDGKSIAAVTYDRHADGTPNMGSVTLGGAGATSPVALKNVADAKADHDALNLGQLKNAGLVGDDGKGNLTSLAVTYDGAAKDSVTLGGVGATTPVAIHNVKDGELSATSKDAVNGSQLFATNTRVGDLEDSLSKGGVIDPITGESLAVVYDGNAKDTVTLKGTNGTTLSNVKAGVADMDAVNVSQLKGSGLIGDDGKSIAAVTYDRNADGTPNYGTVTLGNGAGPTQVKNVADATDDHDALNLGQLKDAGLVGDDGKGNLTSLAVTYDGTAKDSVTLGGAGATTPVAIHNVKEGELSATSKDAVNGSQLFATNTRVGDLEDSLSKGGVIDPITGESLAVVYDGNAKDTVTLKGTNGTTLSNVKAGAADMDAVNVSQLKGSGLIGDDGKSIAAVTYDRNADGTPNYNAVTMGGSHSTGPVTVSNVAAGVAPTDAVNVQQMQRAVVEGNPYIGGRGTGTAAQATGINAVALGLGSVANEINTISVGNGATGLQRRITNVQNGQADTDAATVGQVNDLIGVSSTNTQMALNDIDAKTRDAIQSMNSRLDSINTTASSDSYVQVDGASDGSDNAFAGAGTFGVAIGAEASATGVTAIAIGPQSVSSGTGSVALGAGASATGAGAVAFGSGRATGTSALALGNGTVAGGNNAVAAGFNSQAAGLNALALGNTARANAADSMAFGTTAQVDALATNSIAIGRQANVTSAAQNAVALGASSVADRVNSISVGSTGQQRQIIYVARGTSDTDAVNVSQLKDAMSSFGGNAGVGADGSIVNPTYTIGGTTYRNVGDALNALENLGSGTDPLAVTYGRNADGSANFEVVALKGADGTTLSNVKAGVAAMDAVNVSQLKGSGLIGDDGKAIAAVTYDRNADGAPNYGAVTLGNGMGPTQIKNVADATEDGDALNLGQLKNAGLVGEDGKGNLTSLAVTYDSATKDSVTLGGAGAAAPVALHNVADGVLSATSKDAVNGSQLFATNQNLGNLKDSLEQGGVIDPVTGESLAVVYDSATKNSVTLGNAGTPVGIHNLAAGVVNATSNDAINGSQLFTVSKSVADKIGGGAGVGADGSITDPTYSVGGQDYHSVGDALGALDKNSGNNPLAVVYDGAAKDAVTLGGAGATTPVALKNVADAKDDGDALNLGQLKNAGLVGDDGAGNLTSAAMTYDKNADGTINHDKATLAGTDGTTLSNVKAGVADMDAVNVSQLKDAGLIDPSTGKSIAAVTYDSAAKDSVTLGGAGATTPVALKNVADGTERHDAINLGQLQDAGLVAPVDPTDPGKGLTSLAVTYDGAAKDAVTLKGADGTTLSNVKAGMADMDAVNVSQLKDAGLIDPSTGKPIAAVTYDSAAKDSVTLGGAGATTPVALKNVADAKDDGDALNLGQLKNAGLVGEDGAGNLTSAAMTYDKNADGTINRDKATLAGTDGTTLSNVKAGMADMDAVNVSQLKDAGLIDPSTGKPIAAVTYDSAAKNTVTLGGVGATTPVALKNVADGTERHDAINLGQLQDAGLVAPVDPTNPGAGLTSLAVAYDNAAQDTVTLKGADGTTLTNVKAGAVTATSTDAVNGAQLHGTAQSVADSLGGGSTVGADGKVTNPTYSLADPDDASKSKSYNNVGDALSNLDGRTTTNTENITVINKQLADSGLVDPVSGQSIAAVTYDRNADGTANRGSVTLGGAGATAPVALKNVADGVDKHDAVNVGQLQSAGVLTPIDPTNPGAGLTSLAVTYDKQANGSANFDQITLKGANGTTITNVKAGAVSATSTDAINGAQLHGVSQSVAKSLGGGSTVDANGNVTNPTYTVNDKTYDNVGDAIENISSSLVHGSIGLVQQDTDTREITVAKETDGTSVNFAGTAGDRVLTGVGAGAVSATSRDAINGAQLHGTAQSVADVIGGGTTVDADGKLADTSIEVNGSKYKTVAEAVQAAAQYGATDSLAVRYDLNKDGTPNYGSVTLGGTGAAPVRLGNVADGSSRYDAVNFGQLSELSDRIGGIDDRVGALEQLPPGSGGPGNGGSTGNDYFAGTDVGAGSTTPANAGSGTGNTAAGSGATIGTGANNATVIGSNAGVSQGNGVAIGSAAKSSAEGATAIGSGSNASGNQSVAIGQGANVSGSNSVALGAGSTAYSDDTVSVGSIDRTRTISNVSDGVNATDVATKGQLDRALGGVQGQMNDLSRNAYSGIAAATALTMIPGVDPGKTVSFGIGGATYKGYQAVAFGGEARITQNLKMKAGVGMSSGGNTVGVGASYQW